MLAGDTASIVTILVDGYRSAVCARLASWKNVVASLHLDFTGNAKPTGGIPKKPQRHTSAKTAVTATPAVGSSENHHAGDVVTAGKSRRTVRLSHEAGTT